MEPAALMTYFGTGSSGGKCNIMGYWHTGNTAQQQSDSNLKVADAAKCALPYATRINNLRATPLTDLGASDALMSADDYKTYPDLLTLPAVGGAVVPIYNIPELLGNSSLNLVLSRRTIAQIFLGNWCKLETSSSSV